MGSWPTLPSTELPLALVTLQDLGFHPLPGSSMPPHPIGGPQVPKSYMGMVFLSTLTPTGVSPISQLRLLLLCQNLELCLPLISSLPQSLI